MTTGEASRGSGSPFWQQRLLAGLILFGLWVLLSGKIEVFHLGVGVVSVITVLYIHARLPGIEPEDHPLLKPLRCVTYLVWLLGQMLLSAFHVAGVILKPASRLNPRLIAFESAQPSLAQSVIFANSITLTPGTLSLDLQDNQYLVHALTEDTAEDLLSGNMAGRVARLSGSRLEEPIVRVEPAENRRIDP